MSLAFLDMPEQPDQLPAWLEQQLAGLSLGELVAELDAIHRPAAPIPVLEDVLSGALEAVAEQGLSVLTRVQIQTLLRYPSLLPELQQHLMIHGGEHWQESVRSASELQIASVRVWSRISDELKRDTDSSADDTETGAAEIEAAVEAGQPSEAEQRRVKLGVVALVALVLLAFWAGRESHPEPVPWGWQNQSAFRKTTSGNAYLEQLASAAQGWYRKRPESAEAVSERILQFRTGCNQLIFADHASLDEPDREWLVERCRAWSEKLNQHLIAVEAGQSPLEVRAEADETVGRLIEALEKRAEEIQSRG